MQNFFDYIYVINLDKRPDRWTKVQKQLEYACITKAVRFPAIAKNPSWVGCFESHLAILQKAAGDGAKNVLILEDDAELYSNWLPSWQASRKQIDADWDMIYLGFNLNPDANLPPPFAAPNLLRLNDALTTHAYAVNGKYLAKLIEYVKSAIGTNIPIDVVYSRKFGEIKAYGIYPMLFYQAPGFSDILGCVTDFQFRQNVDHVLNKCR
jgi:GR25 family glycosyltransferase involved in LPS biosynthesis